MAKSGQHGGLGRYSQFVTASESGTLGLKPEPDDIDAARARTATSRATNDHWATPPAYPVPLRPPTSSQQGEGGQSAGSNEKGRLFGVSRDRITAKRSPLAKIGLAVGFGMILAVLSLAVNHSPADGPTATVADEVTGDPLYVVESPAGPPPTMMSSQAVEAPLNPNAIFVSALSGTGENSGTTIDSPLQSLQTALDRVQPGETIYVMDGRYGELDEPGNAHYVLRRGGTPEAWVRIENAPGHRPEIVATDGNGFEVRANYVEVIGLRVRGEGFDPEGNPWGNGMLIRNSHHVNLVDNEISDMPSNGISAVESSNLGVIGNDVHDNAFWNTAQNSGISFWHSRDHGQPPDADGYYDRIIGNRIYRNENKVMSRWHNYEVISDGNGIIIDAGLDTGYSNRILVLNNEIFDNGGRAVLVYRSANVDVLFNTTYRNARTPELMGGPAELAAGQARNVRFINNLVWPLEGSHGLRLVETDNAETAGNLIVTSGEPGSISSADGVTATAPDLANPSIDENTADFRLRPGSPATGAAVDVSPNVKHDRDGNERSGQPPTVGAYVLVDRG